MQTPEPTLHDFVIKLLADESCRVLFDTDPVAALAGAGLTDVTPEDVMDAIPLVLDLASASADGLSVDGGVTFGLSGVSGSGVLASPVGAGEFGFHGGAQGAAFALAFDSEPADGQISYAAHADQASLDFSFGSDLDGLDLRLPELDALGIDPDALGRGGDAVTGTVAGYATHGPDTLTGYLTDTAGGLTVDLTRGVSGPAGQLVPALPDPAAIDLPTGLPAGLPQLPAGLPADLPADLPALPGLSDLPAGLPELPVDLPDLPVDLPHLPAVPALPELPLPTLPSLPGVDIVHDTVGGVTSHIPVVGELTDGLDNHLPFGH